MKKIFNKKVSFFVILLLFPLCILVGKYIRYTLMKNILVDTSIGNSWLYLITSKFSVSEILKATIAGEQNGTAILFYKYLNIFGINSYLGFEIMISIIFNVIVFLMFFKCRNKLDVYQTVFLLTTIVLLNLFCFCLSKEPIQILFFILIFYILLSKRKNKEFWVLSIITLSALLFRKYYILIVYFYLGSKFVINFLMKNKDKKSFFKAVVIISIISIGYLLILLISNRFIPTYYSEFIRVRTRTSDAATVINNIISGDSIILFTINYLLIVIRMLFPIELITHGSKYILYVFYQLLVSYSIIKNIANYKNNTQIKNISILIYIAFLFTSATFEPDFGSWIRHEVVLFPIMMIINDITTSKNNNSNNEKKKKKIKFKFK